MNKIPNRLLSRVLLASVLILLSVSSVKAETTNCTEITTLPAIITVQGVYCLKSDLATSMTSGKAIDIQTNNVTIDFNNFKLGGQAAGAGTAAYGVYALNRKNITLRNANIRGFYYGVLLDDFSSNIDSGGHIIEDSRFDGNREVGIHIEGTGNSVRRNQIVNTGGSALAAGIVSLGPGVEIIDNHVHNTFSSSFNAEGILFLTKSDVAMVLRNRISETTSTAGGLTYGIDHSSGSRVVIRDNQIVNASATGTTAILGGSSDSECLAVGNNLINFTTFISACTDGGGNTTL